MWESGVQHLVRRGGIARRDELVSLGVSQKQIRRRILAGLLVPVNPLVVALPGIEHDLALRTRAAMLARPDAIPTGLSAGALLGPGPWDEVAPIGDPWLVATPDRSLAARFVTHPGLPTVRHAGLIVAQPNAAVVDLLRFLDPGDAARVGRAALQRRIVTLELLVTAHSRIAHLRGAGQLRELIAVLAVGAHSEGEALLVGGLREWGVTGWRANYPVRIGGRIYYIDVAFPGARVAIEVDGRAYHSDPRAFGRDRRRQNDLVAAGWTVLRFTWEDLRSNPDDVFRRIESALRQATIA